MQDGQPAMSPESPRQSLSQAAFVAQLTAAQWRMYSYIRMLTGDREAADEILQETNLALWEQADRFEAGTNFPAWACKVAWFKVLDHRKAKRRLKLKFDDQLVELLAGEAVEAADDIELFERERRALAACVDKLPERHRMVLAMHYEKQVSLADIGVVLSRNRNAVAQLLHRIRATLRACIQQRLAEAAS